MTAALSPDGTAASTALRHEPEPDAGMVARHAMPKRVPQDGATLRLYLEVAAEDGARRFNPCRRDLRFHQKAATAIEEDAARHRAAQE